MNIYFGAVADKDIFDSSCMFEHPDVPDTKFYYGVEFGSNPGGFDEVRIFDGCDRYMPIDMASIESLIKALEMILINHHAIQVAEEIKQNVTSEKYSHAIVECK